MESHQSAPKPAPAVVHITSDPAEATSPADLVAVVQSVAVATPPSQPVQASTSPSAGDHSFAVNRNVLSASTRLIYQVRASRFPYRLSGELLWRNKGDRYQALLRYSALGLTRAQTSHGRITKQGLAPERFSDKYRSEAVAHFNYEHAKVTFSANTPDAPLLAGAQDRLSVLIQLGALLASNPDQIGTGSTLTIQTVGGRGADLWMFTVIATEPLALPGGNIEGIKLERLPREPYDQKVEVWLAPQLDYLPARIRITEANGESIDQLWRATETVEADDSVAVPGAAEPGAPVTGH